MPASVEFGHRRRKARKPCFSLMIRGECIGEGGFGVGECPLSFEQIELTELALRIADPRDPGSLGSSGQRWPSCGPSPAITSAR